MFHLSGGFFYVNLLSFPAQKHSKIRAKFAIPLMFVMIRLLGAIYTTITRRRAWLITHYFTEDFSEETAQVLQEAYSMVKQSKGKAKNTVKVTFVIPHDPDQADVYVVGDFNNWDPTALKLVKRRNDTRSGSTELAKDASYRFRYRTADGVWFNDEAADEYALGDHGEDDCIINL